MSFRNILKKFTLSVDKDNREIGGPQGDGTLAGAWYGMFLDGELVDRYQTDAEGKFTTKEYICGYNWELREIDPSEGYLLDEESHHVPAEPDNFTEEHNPIDMPNRRRVEIVQEEPYAEMPVQPEEKLAELRPDMFSVIGAARRMVPPSTIKGLDAMLLMARGYTCREIGEKLGASDNLVTAWVSKARKYLKGRPQSAAVMEDYAA